MAFGVCARKHCVQKGRLHKRCATPVCRGLQTWTLAHHAEHLQSLWTSVGHQVLTPICGPWGMRKASLIDRTISLRTHKSKHTAFLSKSGENSEMHSAKTSCKLGNKKA
jgi:hypothetical protein